MMKKILIPSYIVLLILFTIFSYLFIDQNLFFLKSLYSGFSNHHREITALIYLVFISTFFLFFFLFLKNVSKINLKLLIIITSVVLFFSYPATLSYDIFNYVETSRVLFKYHENPYLVMPGELRNDPYLIFTRATNKTALYGPFWIGVTGIPYFLGIGNFILTLFSFKVLSLLSYLGISWLIFKITKDKLSVAIFSLNPLVIIESLVSAHNDAFMMFFALLSFYLLSKKRFISSSIFLALSILVKFASLILLPIYLFTLLKLLRHEEISLKNIYKVSALLLIFMVLISFIREEIYPWYAIWFIPFAALIPNTKWLRNISVGFSFGLLLSYLPYIYLGYYGNLNLILRTVFIFTPVFISVLFNFYKGLWAKSLGQ